MLKVRYIIPTSSVESLHSIIHTDTEGLYFLLSFAFVFNTTRREEEVKTVSQENAELVETIRTLNEDMQEIRLRRRTESLLVKLPTMKLPMSIACKNHHGCKTSKNQGVALDLARRLQREIEQTPRIENTFHRLVKEIEMMEEEKDSMERREALLVQMLTQSAGIQKP